MKNKYLAQACEIFKTFSIATISLLAALILFPIAAIILVTVIFVSEFIYWISNKSHSPKYI